MNSSRRKVMVFGSILGVLALTSALLMALAPAPLVQHASRSLFAIEAPLTLDVIFSTSAPVESERWQYIYIRHSRTASGNAVTLGQVTGGLTDHFIIGNGDGCVDGEIQIGQRWNQQVSVAPPPGAASIDPSCISICVVGDFDRTVPTPTQMRRLAQLVGTLQGHLKIPRARVIMIDEPESPAGIGRYFPAAAFREQLLP